MTLAETIGTGETVLGLGVIALIIMLALIGWRRDKRTYRVRAGVFIERELFDQREPPASDAPPPSSSR